MPELPDITVYLDALRERIAGQRLDEVRIHSAFVLRSVTPAAAELLGRRVVELHRLGKRIVIELEREYFIVLHLMIAGRLRWLERQGQAPRSASARGAGKLNLAQFEFESGKLAFTEAGTRKRASLHFVQGKAALAAFDLHGLDVLNCTPEEFRARLQAQNHTLKRALTDPRAFSGIGNAYSDEILHRAQLSPFARSADVSAQEVERLHRATQAVMQEWIARLQAQRAGQFPEHVSAFRPEMAVHGRHGLPCPVCGAPVQRIVYAENETNYCAGCQTGGKIYADRALSRLLKQSWPRSLDELE